MVKDLEVLTSQNKIKKSESLQSYPPYQERSSPTWNNYLKIRKFVSGQDLRGLPKFIGEINTTVGSSKVGKIEISEVYDRVLSFLCINSVAYCLANFVRNLANNFVWIEVFPVSTTCKGSFVF